MDNSITAWLKQELCNRERANEMDYFLTMQEFQAYRENQMVRAFQTRENELKALIKLFESAEAGTQPDFHDIASTLFAERKL